MDDYKFLIYIVGFILYSLYKAFNSNKKKPVKRSKPSSNTDNTDTRPKTFEEILAELSGQRNDEGKREIFEEPQRTQAPDRPLEQKVSYEDYQNADSTLKELYEKGEKLKTINELVDIEKVETVSRFDPYNQSKEEDSVISEIREDFKSPSTAKKAFLYAEIFNRKY